MTCTACKRGAAGAQGAWLTSLQKLLAGVGGYEMLCLRGGGLTHSLPELLQGEDARPVQLHPRAIAARQACRLQKPAILLSTYLPSP